MTRYFFRGGMMPAQNLFSTCTPQLKLQREWTWSGTNYQQTAEAWLQRHDSKREQILEIFVKHYGPAMAKRWFVRWRIFYLSVAELFGYRQGQEWLVKHCLLQKIPGGADSKEL
jgi:cyclopropane-fatty-acyl-phospholipid synthase